jgi:hypothetical protein
VPPRRELAPEGDRGKGVAGVAEGGEEEAGAARLPAARSAPVQRPAVGQTSSASSRIIALRASDSVATGVVISVPTPVSR